MPALPDALFWKRKLAAFLHDSPSKPLDIRHHALRAEAALRRAGLIDDIGLTAFFDRGSDHTAAAADRIPFPQPGSGIRCHYDPETNPFRHPLGTDSPYARSDFRLTTPGSETIEQDNQPADLITGYPADSAEDWRSRFFAHWRLWRSRATDAHAGFAALPADTRIPDHTIWTHMGVVSALEGCGDKPALLKFQLGPVQDFIAAARSTRDLWSGSMLLSWLMAAGLARLAELLGPDSVIYPNLWGQPLIDLRFRDSIWSKLRATEDTRSTWDAEFSYARAWSKEAPDQPLPLHTPNLPNVFLALVPGNRAPDLAREVEIAIRTEWELICDRVLNYAAPLLDLPDARGAVARDARARFAATTEHHLDLAWQTFVLPSEPDELIDLARSFLPADTPEENPSHNDAVCRVERLVRYFTQHLPEDQRDGRYYIGGRNGPKEKLNNLGVAWSVAVALANWQLDATRALRRFDGLPGAGPSGNAVASHGAKDALTGRDPMLFGGSAEWLACVHRLPAPAHGNWKKLFRHADEVGAITLIKRLWHLAYLKPLWGLEPHPMPNTHELASGQLDRDDDDDVSQFSDDEGKYYAVLAFDGDSIGRWVSGENSPSFSTQLAQGWPESPRAWFEKLDQRPEPIIPPDEQLLSLQRPLSPSYHLQFSETLSNFALHCAPRIVAAHGGKVLYAGGDDVLALLPAHRSLACADDLQRVFRGHSPSSAECGITQISTGFLSIEKDHAGRPIPLILPGPRATASVGLAIAHFKQPIQDVVREAQRAEKRAKRLHRGKHALSVSIFKRSGEIRHWDTRFDADSPDCTDLVYRGGLPAAQWLLCALGRDVGSTPDRKRPPTDEVVSSKFPHRLSDLLEPYVSEQGVTDLPQHQLTAATTLAILQKELDHALDRQRGPLWSTDEGKDTRQRLRSALLTYAENLPGRSPTEKFRPLLDLLAAAAFLARQPALKAR